MAGFPCLDTFTALGLELNTVIPNVRSAVVLRHESVPICLSLSSGTHKRR